MHYKPGDQWGFPPIPTINIDDIISCFWDVIFHVNIHMMRSTSAHYFYADSKQPLKEIPSMWNESTEVLSRKK